MKKITLDMCHVHTKIRFVGKEDSENTPSEEEIKLYSWNMNLAIEVSWGGFHATSQRFPLSEVTKERKEQLAESALIWLIKDLRQTRDFLNQYDLSNE